MPYKMDMNQEKEPLRKKLLDEGEHVFEIVSCEPSISKSGNEMFIIELKHEESGYIDKIYPISVQGKRWFLKQILAACGLDAAKDGVYDWDIPDIIGKKITGIVEHEDNEYINRAGETIKGKQHRIVSVKEASWDG